MKKHIISVLCYFAVMIIPRMELSEERTLSSILLSGNSFSSVLNRKET